MIKPVILITCALSLAACSGKSVQEENTDTTSNQRAKEVVFQPYAGEPDGRQETVTIEEQKVEDGRRRFLMESTQDQRDSMPKTREILEPTESLRVESGDVLFDGLFAMAMDDLKLLSVDAIRDDHYNDANEIPCNCFMTGEKWHYVWTRDLAYAVDLSLAYIDPQRTVDSLLFKTSEFRDGVAQPDNLPDDSRQIIQDTGSGGSWAVSTDRVSWSIAAKRVSNQLSGSQKGEFLDDAYSALRGTVEADRKVSYDNSDGLYGGEQSYLDWRAQTYAPWITNNLSQMAQSKALSTNVMHYQAILFTAELSEQRGELDLAQKYYGWAEDLKESINAKFWLEERGLYASLTSSNEVPVSVHKYDMLGTALAIIYGIASPEQASTAMNRYPHAPFGVPVYYPQQPNMYVYHNRGIWPFVTAYALKAGADVQNYNVVDNAVNSLMRGAALNVSNMENFEWLTAKPYYDDGPAINSRRQLWSVAGYLGMVIETVFGYEVDEEGIHIEPFLTADTRARLGKESTATLKGMSFRENQIDIQLNLPQESESQGYYSVKKVELNGASVNGPITEAMLKDGVNVISVDFGALVSNDSRITIVPEVDPLSHTDSQVFSPQAPVIESVSKRSDALAIRFSDGSNTTVDADIYYNIYRNNEQVASELRSTEWIDQSSTLLAHRQCYAVEAVFVKSGNRSHPSEPVCYEGTEHQTIGVQDSRVESNLSVLANHPQFQQPVIAEWGAPEDQLTLNDLKIDRAGRYSIRIRYNNRQHTIDSGVTNSIKLARIFDQTESEVADLAVQMPNVEDRDGYYPIRRSTEMVVNLKPGLYRLVLEDLFNMSYLASNKTYSASGGAAGPVNKASIAGFEIMYLGEN